jgi:L-cysteine S-thiosulfotransferase
MFLNNCRLLFLAVLFVCTAVQAETSQNASVQQGFDIIFNRNLGNCVTCHTLKNPHMPTQTNEIQGNFAPDLSYIGQKYSRAELTKWVTDARKMKPQTLMPPYGTLDAIVLPNKDIPLLSSTQIASVVEALMTLKK